MTRWGSIVGGSLHNVLKTPPWRGVASPSSLSTSLLFCNYGAILGFAARAGGGVEVGSVSSAVDSESPLQATAITKASPATMPINNFGVNFNCLLVMIFFC